MIAIRLEIASFYDEDMGCMVHGAVRGSHGYNVIARGSFGETAPGSMWCQMISGVDRSLTKTKRKQRRT
jgi:hypothetical protein